MEENKRVKTGIPGLDNMLEGGIPEKSIVLVAGGCGTGKSTLAIQFLLNGTKDFDEKGVYVTLEQDPIEIEKLAKRTWPAVSDMISQKKIAIIKPNIFDVKQVQNEITLAVQECGAKRLVIDSVTILSMLAQKDQNIREEFYRLNQQIKKLDCTTIAISEITEEEKKYSPDGLEFLSDGVISLSLLSAVDQTSHARSICVRKMRFTNHILKTVPMQITDKGIVVYPEMTLIHP